MIKDLLAFLNPLQQASPCGGRTPPPSDPDASREEPSRAAGLGCAIRTVLRRPSRGCLRGHLMAWLWEQLIDAPRSGVAEAGSSSSCRAPNRKRPSERRRGSFAVSRGPAGGSQTARPGRHQSCTSSKRLQGAREDDVQIDATEPDPGYGPGGMAAGTWRAMSRPLESEPARRTHAKP